MPRKRSQCAGNILRPPYPPMEARPVTEIPVGEHWQYEPKWDGFRCLIFRTGRAIEIQSKSGKPLTRYFPELVGEIASLKGRFVLDGEIVVPRGRTFSFDALLQRIHPTASRIRQLAEQTPARIILFDILAMNDDVLTHRVLRTRRKVLEKFARTYLKGRKRIVLSPATKKPAEARKWLRQGLKSLDGIIAKRDDLPYQSGNRLGMQKIKNIRSADCVVGGFRYGEGQNSVGSLLLGLYDKEGMLNHVGFTSSLSAGDKGSLTAKLEALSRRPVLPVRSLAGPVVGRLSDRHNGNPLSPGLSLRSVTIISPVDASVTAPGSCAGVLTSRHDNALSDRFYVEQQTRVGAKSSWVSASWFCLR